MLCSHSEWDFSSCPGVCQLCQATDRRGRRRHVTQTKSTFKKRRQDLTGKKKNMSPAPPSPLKHTNPDDDRLFSYVAYHRLLFFFLDIVRLFTCQKWWLEQSIFTASIKSKSLWLQIPSIYIYIYIQNIIDLLLMCHSEQQRHVNSENVCSDWWVV